ncbi:MAG: hypothetical protein B7Y90_02175 [Alphaproteobacteria bacterium 32-64-14]|nr:MAG: hypothetical protein B7Y90_02175 [Alphaproteobacteria bacterium 32-64-14]
MSLAICGAADKGSLASIRAEASQAIRASTAFGFGSSLRIEIREGRVVGGSRRFRAVLDG